MRIAALLVLPLVACVPSRSPVSTGAAEREIAEVERAWGEAERHKDAVALAAILDDRFVLTYGAYEPIGKALVLKNVAEGAKEVDPVPSVPTEKHVLVDGDVAVTYGLDTVCEVDGGRHVKRGYRYTTTFVHRDGRWRALAVQMLPLPLAGEADAGAGR